MKIKVTGNVAVITSGVKVEDLKKVIKFHGIPVLTEGEKKEPVFAINFKEGNSQLTDVALTYSDVDSEGFGTATIAVAGKTPTEKKEKFVDTYAKALVKVEKLEAQIAQMLTEANNTVAKVEESIEVI